MDTYEIKCLYNQNAPPSDILQAYQDTIAEKGIDACGEELIFLAADFVHVEALKLLIDKGVNPSVTGDFSRTLLHYLAKMDCGYDYHPDEAAMENAVNLLLDLRVSALRKEENEGFTCYHYAARSGNHRFIETLAKRGVKLNMTDPNGNTALHIACENVRRPVNNIPYLEKELEQRRAKAAEPQSNEIWGKRAQESLKEAELSLLQETELLENYFKIVKCLLEYGLDPLEKNRYDQTPLDLAIKRNAKKIAALLKGEYDESNPDSLAAGGMTFCQAADKGDAAAIRAIAKTGADVNGLCSQEELSWSNEGMTPLAIACKRLTTEAVDALLECGANPSLKDGEGKAAVIRCLSPDAPLNNDLFKVKIPAVIQSLVKAGFPINEPVDDDSNTLLNFACQCGWTTGYNHYSFKGVVIDEALRHGADVNLSNHSGVTPLMNACNKYFDLMEKYQLAFLENGADVNAKDREGNTALHYAARNDDKNGAKTLCDMLLEFDADISAVNNAGKTALDIAVETNNEPLVKLLLNKIN